MPAYQFDWVDAFAARPFGGNGCAVLHDAADLSAQDCMSVVRETSLVECTFLEPSDVADVRIRYFLASREIPFAGHPTVASVASLFDRGLIGSGALRVETGAGVLDVSVEAGDGGPRVSMRQIAPVFGPKVDAQDVAAITGLDADDFLSPPQIVSTGLPFIVAPLRSKEALRRATCNAKAMADVQARLAFPDGDVMEPFLVTLGGETDAGDTFSRLLLPPPMPPEDPFTGSATGAMAAYLWHHGLISSPHFTAEQGHWMGRPGHAEVEVLGPRDAISGVQVSGQGYVLMRGEIKL